MQAWADGGHNFHAETNRIAPAHYSQLGIFPVAKIPEKNFTAQAKLPSRKTVPGFLLMAPWTR
jgi:hypothetical protein